MAASDLAAPPAVVKGSTAEEAGFRFVAAAHESHGMNLYSVAFLDDAYAETLLEAWLQRADDCAPTLPASREEQNASAASSCGTCKSSTFPSTGKGAASPRTTARHPEFGLGAGVTHVDDLQASSFFATAGGRCVTVYGMYPDGIDPIQSFTDQDTEEDLYAVCWTLDMATLSVLLVAGGKRGPIKVLDSHRMQAHCVLHGHGDAVNDIRAHPTDPALVLSASKDESVRLWNVLGRCCVAVFAGERGHASEVLAGDFHPLGNCFASAGMDNTVKVWPLDGPLVAEAIAASYTHAVEAAEAAARAVGPERESGTRPLGTPVPAPALCQFPVYSTDAVHSDYVDSCAFLGNLLVSRSTDSRLLLWCPDVSARLQLLQTLAKEAELSAPGANAESPSASPIAGDTDEHEGALLATADRWQHREAGPLLAGDASEGADVTSGVEAALEGGATILAELPLPDSSLWFIRLSVDKDHRRVAAGNDIGGVFVWDPMAHGALQPVTEEDALRFAASTESDGEDDGNDATEAGDDATGDGDEAAAPLAESRQASGSGGSCSSRSAASAAADDVVESAVPSTASLSPEQQQRRVAFLAATPLQPTDASVLHLRHPKCTRPVRQTCFSPDGRSVLAVCDGGSVWRYDFC